ncbi:ADP-ribosylation factor-like protein 9 isoform X1 [Seriola lalandi dorsalis]|uniref:ADP-ribosylation factor-like protein 9 isoform X1 n=1 Tax=Seriola lalandi dorsalis TaxID=1841481 RepID=UPI000C6F7E37|nr:ADP-ribosylation factor-like protein 9 isoform X1 [Seriola lalandi dorsalis]XP_056238674.1 ADP-ribosylation factor-like protein 9 isoform X1 [Seriola aureovittata]
MFGLREAGVLGASVVVAGGVAYLIWNYAYSSGEKKPEPRPGQDGTSPREGGEGKKEERKEEATTEQTVVAAASAPVVAATAPKEQSRHVESGGTQVLVLGLDGAGKTSLLHCLATGSLEQDMEPTQGFNAVSVNKEDLHIEFLEIGGKEELRPYWQRYMSKALLLVFVVDSSDPQLFPVAKKHLHELLSSDPSLPLMVLANKQDLPDACSITDLHEALSLSEVGDRRLFLIGTYVKKGEAELSSGVQDARDLVMEMVCEGK